MCGIAGDYGGIEPDIAERMLKRLVHRGPDGEGSIEVAGNCWLGHRRLAIVDVAGGKQPLKTESGDLFFVGNGEIYNHEEVRETLSDDSCVLTRSDNEVALHLYEEKGPDSFSEMHGMYAFIIAGEDGRFIAARDPVGIKPLYWARRNGHVRFASELGAYDEDWQPEAEAFPPGHYWTPEDGLVRFADAVPHDKEDLEQFEGPSEPGAPIPDAI